MAKNTTNNSGGRICRCLAKKTGSHWKQHQTEAVQ